MCLCLLVSGSIAGAGQKQSDHYLTVEGLDRHYFMVVPTGLDPLRKYPLVIILHGGGGNAKRMIEFSGFAQLAQKEKFMALYPDGFEKGWHDGRIAPRVDAYARNIDDVKFIGTIIKEVESKFSVDTSRIFATGISNGAMMSIHLARHLSEKIRAIAPVAGSMAENTDKDFRPAQPVSVLVINGTADKLVPYEGGPVLGERAGRGRVIPTIKMMERWAALAGASGNPTIEHLPDTNADDECTADRLTYSSSSAMAVQLIRINNGGHTWPGGKPYLPKMIVGKICNDFKAEEVIWDFFKNQVPR